MATVTIYGRSNTVAQAHSLPITFYSEKYLRVFLSLLPRGVMWPRDEGSELYELILALSYTYARLERRGEDLLREADPRYTTEMIEAWENTLGLPGDCEDLPDNLPDRRTALVTKLRGVGDPNTAAFEELATDLDFEVCVEQQYPIFRVGSRSRDRIYDPEWAHRFNLHVAPYTGEVDRLQCRSDERKPAHTVGLVITPYTNWQAGGAFGGADEYIRAAFSDGAGNIVAVGGDIGTGVELIYKSTNGGVTWSIQMSDSTSEVFRDVTWDYDHSKWFAVGTGGLIQSSSDGESWSNQSSGVSEILYSVFSNSAGVTVAVGANGTIIRSTNGLSWSSQSPAASYSGDFASVWFHDGLWVAVGFDGELQTSLNGSTWVQRLTGAGTFSKVRHDGVVWQVVGNTNYYSTDGTTWAAQPLDGSFSAESVASDLIHHTTLALSTAGAEQRKICPDASWLGTASVVTGGTPLGIYYAWELARMIVVGVNKSWYADRSS